MSPTTTLAPPSSTFEANVLAQVGPVGRVQRSQLSAYGHGYVVAVLNPALWSRAGRLREDEMTTTTTEWKQDVLVPFAEVDLVHATANVKRRRRGSKEYAAHNECFVKWLLVRDEFLEKHTLATWQELVAVATSMYREPSSAIEKGCMG